VKSVRIPPGYVPLTFRRARAVVAEQQADRIRDILETDTLHDWASRHPEARELSGRGIVYAVPLPKKGPRVVIRHNRHGGVLAGMTGDRYPVPTRAPRELATALRLAEAGIPTPAIVAYAVYPAGPLLQRSDVASSEIHGGQDLAAFLARSSTSEREEGWRATLELLDRLAAAGVRHQDLNLKNILLQRSDDGLRAYLLDVDRVTFRQPLDPEVREKNFRRLERSLLKWRDERGLAVTESDLAILTPHFAG
jgi:hypothetical protein